MNILSDFEVELLSLINKLKCEIEIRQLITGILREECNNIAKKTVGNYMRELNVREVKNK